MKVLIIQDTKNLGKKGEIKEVSDGYAKNFLLPRKIVVVATNTEIKKIEIEKQKQEKNRTINSQKAEELKKKLQGIKIEIKTKVNENGALFAALDKEEIVNALYKKINKKIELDQIIIEEPIKKIGEYKIDICLFADIKANISLIVCV